MCCGFHGSRLQAVRLDMRLLHRAGGAVPGPHEHATQRVRFDRTAPSVRAERNAGRAGANPNLQPVMNGDQRTNCTPHRRPALWQRALAHSPFADPIHCNYRAVGVTEDLRNYTCAIPLFAALWLIRLYDRCSR